MDEAIEFAKVFFNGAVLFDDVKANHQAESDMEFMGRALQNAALNPDTNDYDVLVSLAAELLRQGNMILPEWLASFAADVLEGNRKRPTKRGSDKYGNWERDYKLFRTVQEVRNRFRLPHYTNNELSRKTTAAEIVAEATNHELDVVIGAYKKFNRAALGRNNPQNITPR